MHGQRGGCNESIGKGYAIAGAAATVNK